MASSAPDGWLLESANNGNNDNGNKPLSRDMRNGGARAPHNLSSSSLRKKSGYPILPRIRVPVFRKLLDNLSEIFLGSKLCVLLAAIPFAIAAHYRHFASPWVFALSFLGLIPLAERVSFLTEILHTFLMIITYVPDDPDLIHKILHTFLLFHKILGRALYGNENVCENAHMILMVNWQIAYYTGPTVGGLLNATCGNATELIIAILALIQDKVDVVKYSLLGSILSNLLLVLGSSFFCGGIVNMSKEQKFDRKQANVSLLLLLLGLICHVLTLTFNFTGQSPELAAKAALELSRASGIIMLIAYMAYLCFQLLTHRQLFETSEARDGVEGEVEPEEAPVVEFWAAIVWLILITLAVALLSEYLVGTIEAASDTWGMSVGFLSVILLPIVGNAAEHAGAMIFAFKNKLDISLGIALGSATQISMFVIPITVIVSWILGGRMDLDLNLLQTSTLTLAILVTTFTLQDGTSHYIKGLVLLLCYLVVGACFFVYTDPLVAKI